MKITPPAARLGPCAAWLLTLLACTAARGQVPQFSTPTAGNRPVLPRGANPATSSFIDPTAEIDGPWSMAIGQRTFVAPFARLSASARGPLIIGQGSDLQDNVTIDARPGGVLIGDLVPIAHGATVVGPAIIGGFSFVQPLPTENGMTYDAFVSFNAWIEQAIVEPGALVNGLAKVTGGVTIPAGFQVLPGQLVSTPADLTNPTKVAPITSALEAFEVGVLDVNRSFAQGYTNLFNLSPNFVRGIGYDPGSITEPTNPGPFVPVIGGVQRPVPGFKDRLTGKVFITNNTVAQLNFLLGSSVAIRGDEGNPIVVGSLLGMKDMSTFHSLDKTDLVIGQFANIGSHCVVHGGVNQATGNTLTQIGNHFTLGDDAVVYRSTIGDDVTIGNKCYIDSCTIPSGTVIPDRTILIKGVNKGTVQW